MMNLLSDKVTVQYEVRNMGELITHVAQGEIPADMVAKIVYDPLVVHLAYSVFHFVNPVLVNVFEGKADYEIMYVDGGANG